MKGQVSARVMPAEPSMESASRDVREGTILDLQGLEVAFDVRRSVREVLSGKPADQVRAIDGVDLAIKHGHILGLVGESGSGKTSLARAVIGLEEATGGEMKLIDLKLSPKLSRRPQDILRQMRE